MGEASAFCSTGTPPHGSAFGRESGDGVICAESAHGEMTTRVWSGFATKMKQKCKRRSSSGRAPLSLFGGPERGEEVHGHLSECVSFV